MTVSGLQGGLACHTGWLCYSGRHTFDMCAAPQLAAHFSCNWIR